MSINWSSFTFISSSQGKIKELHGLLGPFQVQDIDLPEIQAATDVKVIEAKLESARHIVDGDFFVEDTCLEFDGMAGLPGPYIKWFIQRLGVSGLSQLAHSLDTQAARAVSTIGLVMKGAPKPEFFRGEVAGKIIPPQGSGFGWDAIFQPDGFTKTFGQMTAQEKGLCSHRAKSAMLFQSFVERAGIAGK